MNGDLLTPDEQLIRHERWMETKSLRNTIIDIFLANGAITAEQAEDENFNISVDNVVMLFNQLKSEDAGAGVSK